MRTKKLIIAIASIVFIVYVGVLFLVFDASNSANILCYKGSNAEKYAKENNVNYNVFADSDAYLGILNLENFEYNFAGQKCTIIKYSGESEKIAIPEDIEGHTVVEVAETAFDECSKLTRIYLPKTVTEFAPNKLDNKTVYCYKDSPIYDKLKDNQDKTFDLQTIADSYYVDFYSADIPFSYNTLSSGIEIINYKARQRTVIIPESIDGKPVTKLSIDVLSDGIETVVIPESVLEIKGDYATSRYSVEFYVTIAVAVLAFIFCCLATQLMFRKTDNLKKKFLGISIVYSGIKYYTILLICATVALIIHCSLAFEIALSLVIFAIAVIELIVAKYSATCTINLEMKTANKTSFVKSITVDAQALMNRATNKSIKDDCKKVFESLRFSDPVDSIMLAEYDKRINLEFHELENAVNQDDAELVHKITEQCLSIISERNLHCKETK